MHLDSVIVVQNICHIFSLIFWYAIVPSICYNLIYSRFVGMYVKYFYYARQKDRVNSMAIPLPYLCHAV